MKRIWDKAGNVALVLLVALAVAVSLPKLLGWGSFAVLSGSMEPAIMTGSLAFVKPADGADLGDGDIVTFTHGGMVVTHRIVRQEGDAFVTKGDANTTEDLGLVPQTSVIGKYIFSIPLLGYLSGMIKGGGIYAVVFAVGLAVLFILPSAAKGKKEEKGEIPNE